MDLQTTHPRTTQQIRRGEGSRPSTSPDGSDFMPLMRADWRDVARELDRMGPAPYGHPSIGSQVTRSTSQELMPRPPKFWRPPESLRPSTQHAKPDWYWGAAGTTVSDWNNGMPPEPLPMSTAQASYFHGILPRKTQMCMPTMSIEEAGFLQVGAERMPRSTSFDSFQSFRVPKMREPCPPAPSSYKTIFKASFGDDMPMPTSHASFQSFKNVRRTQPCTPKKKPAPYEQKGAAIPSSYPRSTSQDAFPKLRFQPKPLPRFRPPKNPPPYGEGSGWDYRG
jgi:hypothetical protein